MLKITNLDTDDIDTYSTIIDWASEFKGLDLNLSELYDVTIRDKGNNTATIKGNIYKIKDFLLSSDYDLSEDRLADEYSELWEKVRNFDVSANISNINIETTDVTINKDLFAEPSNMDRENAMKELANDDSSVIILS